MPNFSTFPLNFTSIWLYAAATIYNSATRSRWRHTVPETQWCLSPTNCDMRRVFVSEKRGALCLGGLSGESL